jgi:hypothetical protein
VAKLCRAFVSILLVAGLALTGTPLATGAPLTTADDWSGTWRGTYWCAQGVTGLTLSIKAVSEREVQAMFAFHAVAENPTVPSGAFEMSGVTGKRPGHLALTPIAWTDRPIAFVMVSLEGDYDPISGEYRGNVGGPGCSHFVVRRDQVSDTDTAPKIDASHGRQ